MALIPIALATAVALVLLRLVGPPSAAGGAAEGTGDRSAAGESSGNAAPPEGGQDHGGDDEDDEDVVQVPPEDSVLPAPAGVSRPPSFARWAGGALSTLAGASTLASIVVVALSIAGERDIRGVPLAQNLPLALILVSVSLWAIYLLWKVPQWQAAAWASGRVVEADKVFEIENASRGTLGQIVSGVAVLAGLLFAWQQLGSTSENLRVSQEGQITDRFSRAVDQLASENQTTRIGGVYALERIARDSERDYGPVMEVLSAFVHGQALSDDGNAGGAGAATPFGIPTREDVDPDVEAVLQVIGRRTEQQRAREIEQNLGCVDLSGLPLAGVDLSGYNLARTCLAETDLRGAILQGTDLTEADLNDAQLAGANLDGARLDGAELNGSDLRGVALSEASLFGAQLIRADLSFAFDSPYGQTSLFNADLSNARLLGADLSGTDLSGATFADTDLSGATLDGAILFGADLSQAVRLAPSQLETALLDGNTKLPEGFPATPPA